MWSSKCRYAASLSVVLLCEVSCGFASVCPAPSMRSNAARSASASRQLRISSKHVFVHVGEACSLATSCQLDCTLFYDTSAVVRTSLCCRDEFRTLDTIFGPLSCVFSIFQVKIVFFVAFFARVFLVSIGNLIDLVERASAI